MSDGTKVYFIDYNRSYIPLLFKWHQEHVAINFPYQFPGLAIFTHDLTTGSGTQKLATCNGEVVGFIWFDIKFNEYEEREEGTIRYVHVDSDYRGRGLGKVLMEYAHNSIDSEATYCILGTHVDNKEAIGLYEKMGYRPYRLIMRRDR